MYRATLAGKLASNSIVSFVWRASFGRPFSNISALGSWGFVQWGTPSEKIKRTLRCNSGGSIVHEVLLVLAAGRLVVQDLGDAGVRLRGAVPGLESRGAVQDGALDFLASAALALPLTPYSLANTVV